MGYARENDVQQRNSIIHMNSKLQLSSETAQLKAQIQQLADENEQMLTKMADYDVLASEKLDLAQQLEQVREELTTQNSAVDYYQSNVIPDIKKHSEKFKAQMEDVIVENNKLRSENEGLKGNFNE